MSSPSFWQKKKSSASRDPDCAHRMYCEGQCCRCGYVLNIFDEYVPSFSYIGRYLQLSTEFVASTKQHKLRIGLGQKKLHLVLGLEHILIDAIKLSQIADVDSVLLRDDIFRLPNDDILVKFRPFVRDFLSEAKEFFTMHVYTNYGPDHAKKVVSLLDPHMVYFGNRIITSRDSDGGLKSLELVLAEPRGVIVLDYEPRLWRERDFPNLVIISPKYEYFKANSSNKVVGVLAKALNFFKNNKVFEVEGKRKERSGGVLADLLTDLKALHELFFNGGYHDVTHVLLRVFESYEYFL